MKTKIKQEIILLPEEKNKLLNAFEILEEVRKELSSIDGNMIDSQIIPPEVTQIISTCMNIEDKKIFSGFNHLKESDRANLLKEYY
jgi:hypothetical protein